MTSGAVGDGYFPAASSSGVWSSLSSGATRAGPIIFFLQHYQPIAFVRASVYLISKRRLNHDTKSLATGLSLRKYFAMIAVP